MQTPQEATQEDVREAERLVDQRRRELADLNSRAEGGDRTATFDDIERAERAVRLAELEIKAVRGEAAATAERKRQEVCAALRPDIDAFADRFAEQSAAKLEAIRAAVVDFKQYIAEQEVERVELHKRAVACTRDEWRAPIVPPTENAGVGYYGHLLIAGRRRIDRFNGEAFLGKALHLAARDLKPEPLRMHLDYHGDVQISPAERGADPMADLARIVKEMPDPGQAFFVRGPGGAVHERDRPWTDEEVKQQKLTRISAKEAWGV